MWYDEPIKPEPRIFRQCKLEKQENNATISRNIMILNTKAKLNSIVEVEEDNKTWSGNWKIVEVFGEPLPEDDIHRKTYKLYYKKEYYRL